eukprot:scaffold2911_cov414-Prasinococcus_capsulatus_cf.AAC.10
MPAVAGARPSLRDASCVVSSRLGPRGHAVRCAGARRRHARTCAPGTRSDRPSRSSALAQRVSASTARPPRRRGRRGSRRARFRIPPRSASGGDWMLGRSIIPYHHELHLEEDDDDGAEEQDDDDGGLTRAAT